MRPHGGSLRAAFALSSKSKASGAVQRRAFTAVSKSAKKPVHMSKASTRQEIPPPEKHEAVLVLSNGATITKRLFKANVRPKLVLTNDITNNRLWMSERAKRIQAEKLLQKDT